MALRDLFRGGRHERDHERERYPLDPLSRDSWRYEAEARYGAHMYRDFDDERRDHDDRWENSEQRSGQERYGGSGGNPFLGDRPLMRAGYSYDSGNYFGSKYGLPTTPWRGERDNTDADDLVYGGRIGGDTGDSRSQYARGPHRGRGPRGYRRSDERIKEDVCQCLTDDPYIDASNIEVAVNDREVLLSGSVTSRMQKRHAEDLIESLPGVRDVINGLKVETQAEQSQSSAAQSAATQSSRRGGTFR